MKSLKYLIGTLILGTVLIACGSDGNKEEKATSKATQIELSTDKANIVYFHFSRRCATCIAIEDVGKEVANATPSAVFFDFNLDEDSGEEMGKKLNIEDQSFLIIKGDKQIDLTEEAFLNARSNPDIFKSIIEEKISSL